LYDWVLSFAQSPYGTWALLLLAFSEAIFFPVPPDVLLIVLAVSIPRKSFWYAFVTSVGSVSGGMIGYFIGLKFMEMIGLPIINFYGAFDSFERLQLLYQKWDAWAVSIAGFTPLPYKLFTIAAGACKINFPIFVISSLVSRSARFFLVGGLIYWFGALVKTFIERRFNILSLVFAILLILGFIIIKWLA
jgi:membrane protein YqaA with SNARE-associated domain